MNSQRSNNIDMNRLNESMSRRGLLQLLGGTGIGLAAGQPLPKKSNAVTPKGQVSMTQLPSREKSRTLTASSSQLWIDPLPNITRDGFVTLPGIYNQGQACLIAPAADKSKGAYALLVFDIHSGGSLSNFNTYWLSEAQYMDGFFVSNGVLAAPQAANMFAVSTGANSLMPTASLTPINHVVSNVQDVGGNFAFVDDTNSINIANFTQNLATGQPKMTVLQTVALNATFASDPSIAYYDATRMVVALGLDAFVFDISGNVAWQKAKATVANTASSVIAGPDRFWVSSVNTIQCFAYDGTELWHWTTNSVNMGTPVVTNGYVYYQGADGHLTCLDAATGVFTWNSVCSPADKNQLFIEDGVAYWADNSGLLWAADLTKQGEGAFSHTLTDASGSTLWATLLGVENGVCFTIGATSLIAVDMLGELHQFSSDCVMLPDDVQGEPGNTLSAIPVYQCMIALKDTMGNPRANISVKLTVYEECTVTTDGGAFGMTPASPLWLETDSSGRLTFCIQAEDITCPAVYLWASFMDRDEAMIFYPDHQNAARMANATPVELSEAMAFDNSSLLASGVDPNAAALCLRNLMGGSASSSLALSRSKQQRLGQNYIARMNGRKVGGRKRVLSAAADPNTYLSYPDSNESLLYQYPAGQPATRVAGTSPQFSVTIEPNASFRYLAGPSLATAGVGAPQSFLLWDDLKKNVVNGLNDVKSAFTKLGSDGSTILHHFIDDVGREYEFAIHSIDDLFHSIAALFKSICKGIHRVYEWLSNLFNWKDILAKQQLLAGAFCSEFAVVRQKVAGGVAALDTDVTKFFTDAESKVTAFLQTVDQALTGQTFTSVQYNHNDVSEVFKVAGNVTHALSVMTKFQSKLMHGMFAGPTFNDGKQPGSISGTQDALCATVNLDTLTTELAQVFDSCFTNLADDLDSLIKAFGTFLNNLKNLAQNGQSIGDALITDVCQYLSGTAQPILNAAQTIVITAFDLLPVLLDAMAWMLSRPLDIPGISQIWKVLTGETLTVLNALTLVVAIPLSVAMRAANSLATSGLNADADPTLSLAWFLFAELSSLVDGICDGTSLDADNPAAILDWGSALIAFLLGVKNGISPLWTTDLMYVLGLFGIGVSAAGTVLFSQQKNIARPPTQSDSSITNRYDSFSKVTPFLNGGYGMMMACFTGYTALQDPDTKGPDNMNLAANLCAYFAYAMKLLLTVENPYAKLAVGVSDLALPTTANVLSIKALGDF